MVAWKFLSSFLTKQPPLRKDKLVRTKVDKEEKEINILKMKPYWKHKDETTKTKMGEKSPL